MSIITSTWKFKSLVDALGDSINLQRKGMTGRPVGDVIADLIAIGIIRQVDSKRDPDGNRLVPLLRWYRAWKAAHGYSTELLYMTDKMMSLPQVKGMVVISKDAMSMFYGLTPHEMDKAEWAHEGDARPGAFGFARRPPRPFYGISDRAWRNIDSYIDSEIDAVIMSLGARRI